MSAVFRPARRPFFSAAAALLATVTLAACGTTEAPASPDQSAAAKPAGPVRLADERGKVDLPAPAAKIVSLEWGLTENLLALGVQPIGAADVKGYNTYDKVLPLAEATPDVGTRGEPSLDAISALHPDLVVATTDLPENVIAQLSKRAPVLTLRGSDSADPIAYLRKTVTTLADATGTQERGRALLAEFDAKVADGTKKIAAAGKSGAKFVMANGSTTSGTVTVRMYTKGSFLGSIAARLGAANQWTGEGDKVYGLAPTDVEGLTKISDPATSFVYVANGTETDVFAEDLAGNAVWRQLPFVKSGSLHRIPDGIWTFGGPKSGIAYVDALTAALTR
ncbi:ABC transporter substrate-binding protein [Amycolatopsis benzoatilytica]|uniref:ABC transporter substrate-binding protein n=1 Tax=Amycolatopsis benzoatilytica TaxID=346045 RepID=UPI0003703A48|nr:iron-siderophore ABC transporter substrate-binding protein [Amycolatopsis benzoatilytica]